MKKGYVYFIACEPMEALKIGYTKFHPRARISALQTGCPAPLKLYAHFPGSMDDERRLHQVFAPLHIQGEWFRKEGKLHDMAAYIGCTDDRAIFLDALHDCVMQGGGWMPGHKLDCDTYFKTGDWEPFRKELWNAYGPWED